MKKIFKKSIACLIAVLMVVSVMPLTTPVSVEAADVSSIEKLTFDKAVASGKGYHYGNEATGGYDNILYCSTTTVCEKDFTGVGDNGNFKTFAPASVVMLYDGTTAGFPITLECYSNSGLFGSTKTYNLRNIQWNGNSSFEFKHPWYGYIEKDWESWPGKNDTNKSTSQGSIPINDSSKNIEMQHKTHRIYNNEVYYKGTGNSTDYYESISGTKVQIDVNNNKGTKSTNSSIYVLDYNSFYSKVETVKSIKENLVAYPNRYTATSSEQAINAITAYNAANERVKTAFNNINDDSAASTVQSVATDMKNAVAAINAVNLECAHNTTRVEGAVPATCVSKGQSGTVYCAYCDNYKIADSYETAINPNKHTNMTTIPAVEATCTKTGLTAGEKCTACDTITLAQQETPMIAHTEVIDKSVAPTCTETGLTEGKHCSVCDEVLVAQQTVDALGHDLKVVDGSAVAPTCTQAGKNADKKCSRCDYIEKGAEISATGHNYKSVVTAPTCTEQGYTTYTCSEGDHTYKDDYTDALGHDLKEVDGSAQAPTCTETGKHADKKCSRCDYTETGATIDAKGHTEVEIPAVDATCTTAGSTAGTKCSVCDVIIEAPETIPAKGHSYNYTYNNDGTHTKACANCDDSTDEACTNELKEMGTTSDTWHCTVCKHEYERAVANMTDLNLAIVELEALVNADDAAYRYDKAALATAKEVIANAKAYAQSSDNRYATKEEVEAETKIVLSAETDLTKDGLAQYTVTFALVDGDTGETIEPDFPVSMKYGEVAEKSYTFNKDEEGFPEYVVCKWTKKVLNSKGKWVETTLNSTANDMSVVVKENATYTCYVLKFKASTDVEGVPTTTRVRYLDKSGKTLKIDYATIGDNYVAQETSIAPLIPYYKCTGWERVFGEDTPVGTRELVYRAVYDFNETEANRCTIVGLNGVYVNGTTGTPGYTAYYDEKIELKGADKYAYANADGSIIAPINENYIFAPHLNGVDKTIYITKVETPVENATSIITGTFTTKDDPKYNYLVVNAQFYLPEGATAVESGVVIGKQNDANVLKIGSATKVVSTSQGDNHEYSIQMSYSKGKSGTLYARSYLIYVDGNGDTQTVYSDDITTCILD